MHSDMHRHPLHTQSSLYRLLSIMLTSGGNELGTVEVTINWGMYNESRKGTKSFSGPSMKRKVASVGGANEVNVCMYT